MRLRGRLLVALALAGLVAGGGFAMEAAVEPSPPAPAPEAAGVSHSWYCPHGGGTDWDVRVVLANPGDAGAAAVITVFQRDGRPEELRTSVPPMSIRTVDVPAGHIASASLVESFEAPLAASMVVARPEDGGLAAEPCGSRSGDEWVVPDGSTLRGEDAWVVAFNPFWLDAVFDATLVLEDRSLQPGPLQGVVLPARRAVAFNLNRFALGEEVVGARLEASLGRISAGGLVIGEGSGGGLRSSLAVMRASRGWMLAPGREEEAADLALVAGRRSVPFQLRIQGESGQATALEDSTLEARRAGAFEVPDAGGAAIVAESQGQATLFAGRRFRSEGEGDVASTVGARRPGPRWVVVPGWAPDAEQVLALHNPGEAPATVQLTLLDGAGSRLPAFQVGSGRTISVPLEPTDAQTAVLVEADAGGVIASASSLAPSGYAVSLGVRLGSLWDS